MIGHHLAAEDLLITEYRQHASGVAHAQVIVIEFGDVMHCHHLYRATLGLQDGLKSAEELQETSSRGLIQLVKALSTLIDKLWLHTNSKLERKYLPDNSSAIVANNWRFVLLSFSVLHNRGALGNYCTAHTYTMDSYCVH